MAQTTLKLGNTNKEVLAGINSNFTELYANKVDKISGKGLSTLDFTQAYADAINNAATKSVENLTLAGWGTLDANGYYNYTITTTRTPLKCFAVDDAGGYKDVFVQMNSDSTKVTITSEIAFEGYIVLL